MLELFNPAGLRMLEDRQGAVAYGYVAPRVLYTRVVGSLSNELGTSFVRELTSAACQVATLAYFADASALREYDQRARSQFRRFIVAERQRFASIVMLTPELGGPAPWALGEGIGVPIKLLREPLEFERALCNVAPFPDRTAKDWGQVWQVHAPR